MVYYRMVKRIKYQTDAVEILRDNIEDEFSVEMENELITTAPGRELTRSVLLYNIHAIMDSYE